METELKQQISDRIKQMDGEVVEWRLEDLGESLDHYQKLDVIEYIHEALSWQLGYVEAFDDPDNCLKVWKAYLNYLVEMDLNDHCYAAIEVWREGYLDEYLDEKCPKGPR